MSFEPGPARPTTAWRRSTDAATNAVRFTNQSGRMTLGATAFPWHATQNTVIAWFRLRDSTAGDFGALFYLDGVESSPSYVYMSARNVQGTHLQLAVDGAEDTVPDYIHHTDWEAGEGPDIEEWLKVAWTYDGTKSATKRWRVTVARRDSSGRYAPDEVPPQSTEAPGVVPASLPLLAAAGHVAIAASGEDLDEPETMLEVAQIRIFPGVALTVAQIRAQDLNQPPPADALPAYHYPLEGNTNNEGGAADLGGVLTGDATLVLV